MQRSALRFIAAFLLGLFVGGAVTIPLLAYRIEELQIHQGKLVQQLLLYRSRLEKLTAIQEQPRTRIVREVDIQLLWPDEAARLDLSEHLAPLSNELVGRQIERIDPYLVYAIFDGRLIDLENRRYRLSVRAVVIAEETVILLSVTEEEQPTGTL